MFRKLSIGEVVNEINRYNFNGPGAEEDLSRTGKYVLYTDCDSLLKQRDEAEADAKTYWKALVQSNTENMKKEAEIQRLTKLHDSLKYMHNRKEADDLKGLREAEAAYLAAGGTL